MMRCHGTPGCVQHLLCIREVLLHVDRTHSVYIYYIHDHAGMPFYGRTGGSGVTRR